MMLQIALMLSLMTYRRIASTSTKCCEKNQARKDN